MHMNLTILISLIGTNILVLITLIYMLIKLKELIKTVASINYNNTDTIINNDQNKEIEVVNKNNNINKAVLINNIDKKKRLIKRVY